MTQTTKSMALYCLITCMAISSVGAEKRWSLTNLVNYLMQAETVTLVSPTNAAKELAWLGGKWECRDRALRILPYGYWSREMPTPTSDYPWMKTIEISREELSRSATNANLLKISLRCSFQDRPGHSSAAKSEAVAFELEGTNLKFRDKPAHIFWLKRERSAQPRWMLLEKQESGELLFFRKTEIPTAAVQTR